MFGASLVVLFIIRAVMGLRVSEQDEFEGMDAHECGMHAYPEFVSANTSDMDGTPLRSSAAADGLLASRKPVQR